MRADKVNERFYIGIKVIASLILIMGVVIAINKLNLLNFSSSDELVRYLREYNNLAPVIYIILFTIVPLTPFPDSLLAIGGGLAFGVVYGSIYTVIGAVMGGSLAFLISRLLGADLVSKVTKGKVKELISKFEEKGFFVVLILRLIPVFAFDLISYGAGLSKMKYRDFVAGTTLGVIPGVLVFCNIGDSSRDIWSVGFFASILFLVVLALSTKKLMKYIK